MNYNDKRRQQFLTEDAYIGTRKFFEETGADIYRSAFTRPDFDASDRSLNADAFADETFANFLLKYTAGESIDLLRQDFEQVVSAFELAARYVQEYAQSPTFPPLRFIEIDEYERVLQLIGLSFLLHRRDLLQRIASIFDPSSAASDTLYEDLLAFELDGRTELDTWYHDAPYRDLINSMYRDTDDETTADIERYLKNWYTSLAKAPWHDSHLGIEDDSCAGYFGYWAIEAAAVVYLMDLNDSAFREQLVYPKDLVDFAKAMNRAVESSSTVALMQKEADQSAQQPAKTEK